MCELSCQWQSEAAGPLGRCPHSAAVAPLQPCASDCQFSFKVYFYEKQEEKLGLPKMSKKLIYG